MLFVYVTVLSTGSAWLFTLFAIVTALLPDMLVAMWESYSVGGGVLVNKVFLKSTYNLVRIHQYIVFQYFSDTLLVKL